MDPFESFDNKDSDGHLMQKVSWLIQPMGELMNAHLQSLAEYPPVQGGKSFDMSNVVQEFINKSRQQGRQLPDAAGRRRPEIRRTPCLPAHRLDSAAAALCLPAADPAIPRIP